MQSGKGDSYMDVVLDKKTDKELRTYLSDSGKFTRNENKAEVLKLRAKVLKDYFKGQDVTVDKIMNSGFTTLGFISLNGNDINVDDEQIVEVIRQGAAYANVILDSNYNMHFELGYTELASSKPYNIRSQRREGTAAELEDLIVKWSANYDIVSDTTPNSISFADEFTIRNDHQFWDILGIVKGFHIFRSGTKAIRIEFEI